MLLHLAIGDAYGAGFEYAPPERFAANTLRAYVQHPKHAIAPGSYTDDTQMSLAIAEAIVEDDPWTRESLAARFVEVFKRDPREGYAGGFHRLLERVNDGAELLAALRPDSDKSGAAMRAAPIGVFPDLAEVIHRSRVPAAITHATPDGINAAVAASLLAHYFLYDLGPRADLGRFLEEHVPGDWSARWSGEVGAQGWMSVRAAITALQDTDRLGTILQQCVDYRGDVDTVAAIAMAGGSCSREITDDLPDALTDGLESGVYGRDYLRALNRRLLARVKRD
jgi:ADP-ribosylglycohydrolase